MLLGSNVPGRDYMVLGYIITFPVANDVRLFCNVPGSDQIM